MSVHVITASAGSGKTYRLTEALSERLSQTTESGEPVLRASEVIATTCTVRAAADLIEKTQKRLLDDGNIHLSDGDSIDETFKPRDEAPEYAQECLTQVLQPSMPDVE